MILSFARTTAALVAGQKTVTRRQWAQKTIRHYQRKIAEAQARGERGYRVDAWSAGPHRRGKSVGTVVITSVTEEPTHLIPDSDWEAEGFAYMEAHGLNIEGELSCAALWRQWREDKELVTAVVRFDPCEVLPGIRDTDFLPNREVLS